MLTAPRGGAVIFSAAFFLPAGPNPLSTALIKVWYESCCFWQKSEGAMSTRRMILRLMGMGGAVFLVAAVILAAVPLSTLAQTNPASSGGRGGGAYVAATGG